MNSKSVIARKMHLMVFKFRHDILYQSINLTRILFHSRVMTTTSPLMRILMIVLMK